MCYTDIVQSCTWSVSTQNEKGDILAIFPQLFVVRQLNIPDIRPPRA